MAWIRIRPSREKPNPDPTFEAKPDPDPTFEEKKLDPDPTIEKKPDPVSTLEKTSGLISDLYNKILLVVVI